MKKEGPEEKQKPRREEGREKNGQKKNLATDQETKKAFYANGCRGRDRGKMFSLTRGASLIGKPWSSKKKSCGNQTNEDMQTKRARGCVVFGLKKLRCGQHEKKGRKSTIWAWREGISGAASLWTGSSSNAGL